MGAVQWRRGQGQCHALAAGTPIEVWRQDEARVGQQGTLTYIRAEKGSQPTPQVLRTSATQPRSRGNPALL